MDTHETPSRVRRPTLRLRVLAGTLLGGLACGVTGPSPDAGALLQTDARRYELRWQSGGQTLATEIPYEFHNRTGATVYIPNCNGAFALRLERWQAGEWVFAWAPFLNQCLSAPILVDEGALFADTLHVLAALPGLDAFPQWDVRNPTGTYRIVWIDALTSYDTGGYPFGLQLPLEQRVSNPVALTVEEGP